MGLDTSGDWVYSRARSLYIGASGAGWCDAPHPRRPHTPCTHTHTPAITHTHRMMGSPATRTIATMRGNVKIIANSCCNARLIGVGFNTWTRRTGRVVGRGGEAAAMWAYDYEYEFELGDGEKVTL